MLELIQSSTFYKYRPINQNTINMLTKGEIFFSKPSSFNDPFDCEQPSNYDFNESDLYQFIKSKNITNNTTFELQKTMKESIKKNFGGDLSKFITLFKAEKQYLKLAYSLSKDAFRVFCLSKTFDEILMWSHYANYHKGICIGINIPSKDIKNNPILFYNIFMNKINFTYEPLDTESNYLPIKNVTYEKTRPKRSSSFNPCSQDIKNSNYIKFEGWSYERENRIITNANFEIGILNPKYFKEVFFGFKTSEEDIYKIIHEIKKANYLNVYKLKFYKMNEVEDKFELKKDSLDINKYI